MKVIDIQEKDKGKYQILLGNQQAYYLYDREIKKLRISLGEEVPHKEMLEVIQKRGLKYCLHLLERRDYTVFQMEQKLKKAFYDEEVLNGIIDKLKAMGLLDDISYAERFIRTYKAVKSERWIKQKLYEKGITGIDLKQQLEDNPSSQTQALQKAIEKWKKGKIEIDRNKLTAHLYRQGFDYNLIKRMLDKEQN